jgi:hypothetical protein
MVATIDRGVRRWMPIPVTTVYVTVLLAFGVLLAEMNSTSQSRMLFHFSTNLHNLTNGHLATLISSALVTDGPAWTMVPLLGCVLALAEIRFGSRRLVEAFLAGHIGATLLVAVGLYISVNAGWISASVDRAEDVGVSYGAMAVIGIFAAVLPQRWRVRWAAVWLTTGIVGIALGHTFTNVGHCIALSIGLVLAAVMIRHNWIGRVSTHPFSKIELGLLVVAAALGGCFLLG